MIIIKEKHNDNEIFYESEILDNKKSFCTNEIYYRSVIRNKDGVTYMILYDTHMNPISDVFEFLNFYCSSQSINTRIKSLQALKFLYSFQSIVNKDLEDYKSADINEFKYFLRGYSYQGQSLSFEFSTLRNSETINGYLSVYRQFLNYLGKENEALNAKSPRTTLLSLPDCDVDYKVDRYRSNEKTPIKVVEVPRYINVDQFQQIIQLVRDKHTPREEIIIRLMFQCGLRIGEVLGITADDLVMEEIDDTYYPVLYIRNRLSDKFFQQAKTCMKVQNRKDYKSKSYKLKGYGYQKVVVPEDLFDLIDKYIEEYLWYSPYLDKC